MPIIKKVTYFQTMSGMWYIAKIAGLWVLQLPELNDGYIIQTMEQLANVLEINHESDYVVDSFEFAKKY